MEGRNYVLTVMCVHTIPQAATARCRAGTTWLLPIIAMLNKVVPHAFLWFAILICACCKQDLCWHSSLQAMESTHVKLL